LRLAAAVLAAAILIIGLGVVQLRNASVDALPEFGLPQVQVQTQAVGLSAAEVEQLITVPLEDEFNGLPFLNTLRSQSVPGLSAIALTFNAGTDIYRARQLVTERVAQGPSIVNVGTPPVMIQPLSSTSRVMMVGLSSTSVSLIDMSTLARWRIRPRLLAVPGVANVTIWGQRDQQLQVLVDPTRLAKSGVSLDQVINTAGDAMWTSPLSFVQASSPGADGFIDTPNQRISVQHVLPISTPKDLAQVPLEDVTGKPVTLGSVTTVVADHPALIGDAMLPTGPGFLLVVEKFPNANTLAVTKGVETALAALTPGLTGITVDSSVYRPATFVTSALHNVGFAALLAILLVTLWLGVAWQSWRVALIGLVAALLAYVSTAYLLYLTGTTFNALILSGLVVAVGVIVDDIVTGVSAMKQRLVDARSSKVLTKSKAIRAAIVEVRRPLGFAFVVLVLICVPLLALQGFSGSLARPVITTYLLGLVISTLIALVVTPVLGMFLLPAASSNSRPTLVSRWVRRIVDRTAQRAMRRSGWLFAAIGVLAVMALAIIPQLGRGSLIPTLQDRDLVVKWTAMDGTSLPEMERVTATASDDIRRIPGVSDVSTNLGQAQFGDQIVDVNSAETWVTIKPAANYATTVNAINGAVNSYPGVGHKLSTYPALAISSGHVDTGNPLTVRLYGTDQRALTTEAARIQSAISGDRGISNAVVNLPAWEPSIQIAVDVTKAARYGLKPGDIRRVSAVLVSGIPVGSYYQGQQIFDVAVWADPAKRSNLSSIQNLLVDTPGGQQVPLKDVASVTIQPALAVINHDQVSRYVDVSADVTGSIGSALDHVNDTLRSIALPVGYHAEAFSNLANRHTADLRTLWYVLAALVALFLVLQAAFHSWGRALALFVMLPLAISGGALTSLIAGRSITAGALLGFITVFAIALRHGILLIRRIQDLEQKGSTAVPDADADSGERRVDHVQAAVGERSFPLVVTTVAVALAVLPFILRGTVPGVEFIRPLALVVLGGLVTTVVVTLFVLPAVYRRFIPGSPGGAAVPAAPSESDSLATA
jgi:Cu/Ag efflux pump CusA